MLNQLVMVLMVNRIMLPIILISSPSLLMQTLHNGENIHREFVPRHNIR